MNNGRKAFTLVELLIVIGIIGLLAGLVVPSLLSSQDKGYRVKCMSNMKEIYIAMLEYADQHGGRLPWAGKNKMPWDHLQLLVDEGLIEKPELFKCTAHGGDPAKTDYSKKPPFKLTADTCDYTCYNKPLTFTKSARTVVLCDKRLDAHTDGICILYLDNSRKYVKLKKLGGKMPEGVIVVGDAGATSDEKAEKGTKDEDYEDEEELGDE
jgi:prepilin-type N-terminal cleavage/methylation domain-containing protein